MNFDQYLQEMIEARMARVEQGLVCQVISFDKEIMRADVKPYLQDDRPDEPDPVDYPVLPGIPVGMLRAGGFYIRPDYAAGDMVWVTFAAHDVDAALEGQMAPASNRTFELHNAMVVCGVAPSGWSPPTEFASDDGLLIGHEDGDSYIRMEDDKIVMVFGTTEIEFSVTGVKQTIGGVYTTLGLHTHAGPGTPPNPNT